MSTVERAFQLEDAIDHQFCSIAERLGTSPTEVLQMFVTAFVANEGLPFTFRVPDNKVDEQPFNSRHPNIITPPIRNGHAGKTA